MIDYLALAHAYELDVLAERIPACKWVKLACARNARDRQRARTPEFPFYVDEPAARRVCQVVAQFPHIKGPKAKQVLVHGELHWQTITLEAWQCWILTTLFGWKRVRDGLRRFRIALILVPRKNAKSTLAAAVALYMLTADGESGADCFSAATTRDQAKIVAEAAQEMARRSPAFLEYFGVRLGARTTRRLDVQATASKLEPLSADAHSLDGLNIHCAVVDELHAHKTRAVWDVLDTATGARAQPLILAISTAGTDIAGICYEQLTYLRKLLEQSLSDETYFGIEYTWDSEPYTAILQSSHALEELETLCNCGDAERIRTVQCWREACVKHATTAGIDMAALRRAVTILTDQSAHVACAPPVTTNGCSTTTQKAKSAHSVAERNGADSIKTRRTPPHGDTEISQAPLGSGLISSDASSTESLASNMIASQQSRADDAPSVEQRHPFYASIIATTRELFGDSFAGSATLQLVFSETLKNVYIAHSPTCKARTQLKLLDAGRAEVQRPADDWRTEAAHRKANPNYGVSVMPDDLVRKAKKAEHSPAAINNFLTKHGDVWVRAESTWMPMAAWRACGEASLRIEDFVGVPCWLGVDLAETRDIAALIALFKPAVDHYVAFGRFYLPQAAVDRSPIAQYSGWVRLDKLIATPGNVADYQRIQDDLEAWCRWLNVQEVDFDRALAQQMGQQLQAKLGAKPLVITVEQSVKTFNPAMQALERAVLSGTFRHAADPVLTWMASNVVVDRNYKDEIYPRKAGGKDSNNKIDGMQALLTTLSRAMSVTEPSPSIYATRGALVVGREEPPDASPTP